MNWKLIVLGGLAMYAAMFVVSIPMGIFVHEGILDEAYRATESFWRPQLTQDPPDMAALMPRWIGVGVVTTLIFAGIYGLLRGGLSGAPWLKGVKYGAVLAVVSACFMAGWSGVFNLPGNIWFWWGAEGFAYYLVGGAVLGWVGGKVAPETA